MTVTLSKNQIAALNAAFNDLKDGQQKANRARDRLRVLTNKLLLYVPFVLPKKPWVFISRSSSTGRLSIESLAPGRVPNPLPDDVVEEANEWEELRDSGTDGPIKSAKADFFKLMGQLASDLSGVE